MRSSWIKMNSKSIRMRPRREKKGRPTRRHGGGEGRMKTKAEIGVMLEEAGRILP